MWKDKKWNQLTFKHIIAIITYTIVLVLGVLHIDLVLGACKTLLSLLKPFIIGFVLAFIFNIPMRFFLKKLPEKWKKGRSAIAAILSLLCIVLIFVFIGSVVIPQLVDSITMLIHEFPEYAAKTEKVVFTWMEDFGINEALIEQWDTYSEQVETAVLNVAKSILPRIVELTGSIISALTDLVMSIVIAIYFMATKDTLLAQCKKTLYAFLPERQYEYVRKAAILTEKTFSSFFSGQMLEALIIGVLCYFGAMILRLEYALILAVIVGCTNIIPIFGPIIGTVICAILLMFVNPMHALIFVVFGVLLQQFESNLIYPRVVGNSVGLSGMWVLLAVSIGGGLFNVAGMIFGLPIFAVIYRLFADEVNRRVKEKKEVLVVNEKAE